MRMLIFMLIFISIYSGAAYSGAIDLRKHSPSIYKQGELDTCTAQAVAAAVEIEQSVKGHRDVKRPSRLALYYFGRLIYDYSNGDQNGDGSMFDGYILKNDGTTISSTLLALKAVCIDEDVWQYEDYGDTFSVNSRHPLKIPQKNSAFLNGGIRNEIGRLVKESYGLS